MPTPQASSFRPNPSTSSDDPRRHALMPASSQGATRTSIAHLLHQQQQPPAAQRPNSAATSRPSHLSAIGTKPAFNCENCAPTNGVWLFSRVAACFVRAKTTRSKRPFSPQPPACAEIGGISHLGRKRPPSLGSCVVKARFVSILLGCLKRVHHG